MPPEIRLSLAGEDDMIVARQRARMVAGALGFGAVDQSRIATAVSELARNVLRYAVGGRGEVLIREVAADGQGIEIIVSDAGPGIADVDLVLRPGYTSGQGLGMGLPGTKRLMDEMEIESAPGRGTVVTIRKWRR
jgi:serine/threonine-protein kinase RsbT